MTRRRLSEQITPVTHVEENMRSIEAEPRANAQPPRRVFFLLDSFMIGGTETQAVELARRLDPARYRVTIGCLRKEGPLLSRLEGSGVRVIEFSLGKGIDTASGIAGMLRIARFLRRERVQIVHAHDLWSNMVGPSRRKSQGFR